MPNVTSPVIAPASPRFPIRHDATDITLLFNRCFARSESTILVRNTRFPPVESSSDNAREPVYIPADANCSLHRIVFAHDFFASALHEIAHWCIAGGQRRLLVDYGYWYAPDDRDMTQQLEFERVEAKPQAIELAFSIAAGFPFRVSIDNLSGIDVDRTGFEQRVRDAFRCFQRNGFPLRARRFIDTLSSFYGVQR